MMQTEAGRTTAEDRACLERQIKDIAAEISDLTQQRIAIQSTSQESEVQRDELGERIIEKAKEWHRLRRLRA